MTTTAYKGVSAFAIMNERFPVERYLRMMDGVKKPILPVLWSTFGNSTKGIEAFTKKFSDRDHALEIHLSNEVSRRHNSMSSGDFLRGVSVNDYNKQLERGDTSLKQKVFRRVAAIAEKLHVDRVQTPGERSIIDDDTHLVISTGLESQFTARAAKRIAAWVRDAWAAVSDRPILVAQSPVKNNLPLKGDLLELHGASPAFKQNEANGIANLDGTSVDVGDGENYAEQISLAQAKRYVAENDDSFAVILWSARQQGLEGAGWGGSGAPTPRNRTFTITDRAIKAFNRLLRQS